jgi:hypothetical protein
MWSPVAQCREENECRVLRLGQMSYKLGLGAENCPRPYSAQNRRVPKMTLLLGGALLGTLHIYSIYVYIYIYTVIYAANQAP